MDDFEKELKLGFLEEATQAVADVEQCFLSLENDSGDLENLNKIFRLAHNLKGSSKAVGFTEFGAFTHEFESFILKIKEGLLKASPSVVNLLLRANDFVQHMISELKNDLEAHFDFEELLSEMKNINPNEEVSTPESPEVIQESQEVMDSEVMDSMGLVEPTDSIDSGNPIFSAESLEISHEDVVMHMEHKTEPILETLHEEKLEVPPSIPTEIATAVIENKALESKPSENRAFENKSKSVENKSTEIKKTNTPSAVEESIRVSLSKVEELINYVGEMVILQSVMREQVQFSNSPLLKKTVHLLGKVSKEIQESAMSLRMVPIKPTFQKMVRIVRDTAQSLGKEVQLNLVGEDTELDKTVLEKINDPLVHLIRNAVDHGIESSEKRKLSGKSLKGSISLKAYHHGGKLILDVIDDGGGLDPKKLIQKAQEKGLLKAGIQLSDREAYQLIFAPGFSTKEQVTDVSGRGVGMDVVKTNIHEMGGEVLIESQLGVGTTFRIVLPLTLAIVDAMVVSYSNEKFVIPLAHIHETVPTKDHKVQTATGLGEVILLRGENLRLIRLGDFFAIKNHKPHNELITIIIRSGPEPFAILVDDIIGQYQVVIKQLSPELQNIKGISGSSILGDGKPALIIEPTDLLKRKIIPSYQPLKNSQGANVA